MSSQNDLEREPRRKADNDSVSPTNEARRRRPKPGQTGEVGDALRTVYQHTIDEDIPPEMLDLLGKLG